MVALAKTQFVARTPVVRSAKAAARAPVVRVRAEAAPAAEGEKPIHLRSTAFKAVMDIDEIMKILPHRFPFLLVDRVIDYEQGKYAVAIKNVTINDNFFPGHFPQRPIMPGVLMVEAMAQVGGIVMLDPKDEAARNQFFFGGIEGCRFRKPVVPGDTLVMRVECTKFNKRFGVAKMDAKGYVGDELVVEAELTLVMAASGAAK